MYKRAYKTIKELDEHIKTNEERILELNKYIRLAKANHDVETLVNLEDIKREYKALNRRLRQSKKELMQTMTIYAEEIDKNTKDIVSPMAKVGRILAKDFEVTTMFGSVNSQVLKKHLDTNLSTAKIHKAVLDNMPDVKFRTTNGGYLYTLNYKNINGDD